MSSEGRATEGHRTLAAQLRSWPDERLTRLLLERPDLASPAPHDSGQLASRASARSSVVRALDQLSLLELTVLDALVAAGTATPEQLAGLVRAEPDRVAAATVRLLDLALVWEAPGGLRPLTGAVEVMAVPGPGSSGVRPFSDPPLPASRVAVLLDELSPQARRLVEHVDSHGGQATTGSARHTITPDQATTPAEELLSRGLLVPRAGDVVVLPGEVAVALRGGRTTRDPVDDVPALATSDRDQALVDRAAAGAVTEALHRVELLLDHWGTAPPAGLRGGGLPVRDLKAAATLLHTDERTTALLLEVAAAAGLLSTLVDPRGATVWAPTDAYDTWGARDPAARWLHLARYWLRMPRTPGLVGTRDPAGKPRNALTPELRGPATPGHRTAALDQLRELPAGRVLATGTGVPSLVARLTWLRPRRPGTRAQEVAWALEEAAVLGITGLGGLATYARPLLAGEDDTAAAALTPLLPEPVTQVVIQADLTAVAPGPLESDVARRLHLLADVESRGGATVHRFSAGSVRRALDAGWSALEIHEFLDQVAATDVPQPLRYLVDDTARTFGSIRLGHAEAFLRADDESVLSELLHHPGANRLGLRRIAPTVLVSDTPLDVLLPRLRELGAAPVVEAPDGTVRVARPDLLRARTPRAPRHPSTVAAHGQAVAAQVAAAVRAGDRVTASRPREVSAPLTPSGSLAALREAIEARSQVVIGYVDSHGTRTERLVEPVRVEGGQLTAYDVRSDDTRSFAVHRVVSVRPAGPADASP